MFYFHVAQKQTETYDKKVDIYAVGLIYFELLWHFGTKAERGKVGEIINSKCNCFVTNECRAKNIVHAVIFSFGRIYGGRCFQKNSPKCLILK